MRFHLGSGLLSFFGVTKIVKAAAGEARRSRHYTANRGLRATGELRVGRAENAHGFGFYHDLQRSSGADISV